LSNADKGAVGFILAQELAILTSHVQTPEYVIFFSFYIKNNKNKKDHIQH